LRSSVASRAQRGVASTRIELSIFVVLVLAGVAPLYAGRYLPFFDYPAHLAVPAALRYRGLTETRVAALWSLDLRVVPNCLHYAFTYLGSFLLPLEEASRLFVAVFCVAALPPSVAMLLRTFGRDWRLAVLAIPLAWNRCLWYGFVGFCAALPLSCVALALLARDLKQPHPRRAVTAGLLFAVLPFAHFFAAALTGVIGVALVLARSRTLDPRRWLRAGAPMVTAPAVIAPWFVASWSAGPEPPGGTLHRLLVARPDLSVYAGLLRHWFMDGYMNHFDDTVAVLMVLTVAALHGYSRREAAAADPSTSTRVANGAEDAKRYVRDASGAGPLVVCAILAALYLALPFSLDAHFLWWGMNVRVIPLLFIWLLIATPPGRLDRVGRALLVPVAVATAVYGLYVAADIHSYFNGPEGMEGLAEVLAQVPPGSTLLGLYTDYRQPPHYAHYPYFYASSYAVVRAGGVAAPFIPIPQSWTNPRIVPAFPAAGDAALFRYDEHAQAYSHFLVRTCVGTGCVRDPLEDRAEVRQIAASGRWRLYTQTELTHHP
jgi:hypothetical protein